jgi:hypothetical protein
LTRVFSHNDWPSPQLSPEGRGEEANRKELVFPW